MTVGSCLRPVPLSALLTMGRCKKRNLHSSMAMRAESVPATTILCSNREPGDSLPGFDLVAMIEESVSILGTA